MQRTPSEKECAKVRARIPVVRERLSHGGRLWPALSVVAGLALVLLTASSTAQSQRTNERAGARDGYVDADACAGCHSEIWETYRQTGMGRSFARMTPASVQADFAQDNIYHHQASGRHYKAYQRDGKFYLRRHQINADGAEVNVVDKEIHYVVGSGNHARSYLHRTPDHRLLQMPLTWYSAEGGYWAMSPGYDQPNHVGFRRVGRFRMYGVSQRLPGDSGRQRHPRRTPVFPGRIPEGIDCQRCHGPGREHIRALQESQAADTLRRSIVNPGRLPPQRELEVCMQCHLETTSRPLPHSIVRHGRGFFSYRPGEPLADFMLHFDHAPGTGHDDKFEVVQSVYRLRKSACFRESQGRMTCTTCHDPHHAPRGSDAATRYSNACRSCHEQTVTSMMQSGRHPDAIECLSCHMPRRRTDDAVHSVMTDHYIQRRRPERDLLAPRKEVPQSVAYRGEVALYYPPQLEQTSEANLYLAAAQVKDGANLENGIASLQRAIEQHEPTEAEFYFELAEAYLKTRQFDQAIRMYEAAIERRPNYLLARRNLGLAFLLAGRLPEASATTRAVLTEAPDGAEIWNTLGETYYRQRKLDEAVEAFEKAVALDPDQAEALNNLGAAKLLQGSIAEAEQSFREAVRIRPDFAAARKNLAALPAKPAPPTGDDLQQLISSAQSAEQANRLDDAARLYEQILAKRPKWAAAALNLGLVYHSAARYPERFACLVK